jgi:eukaryotic-like serine/threonine-protein kinase
MFRQNFLNAQIGEYQITDSLGAGGMGEVYRAVHTKLGRVAAIKVLTRMEAQSNLVERFHNEARIQASLQHPAIATLYDFVNYNGYPCIVMEFVDGMTLDELLRANGTLPLTETLRIFKAVVAALAYMHSHTIVHRDIKANNIKVTSTGAVKLLDFGISKSAATPQFTEVGSVIGTWHYLAPEQIYEGVSDARSDVWALGVLLYEMLTGTLPFEATTFGSLSQKISKAQFLTPSILNQTVPPAVEAIVRKCLRKSPAERYASAQELLRDVERLESQSEQIAIPQTPRFKRFLQPGVSWMRRQQSYSKALPIALSALLMLILAFALSLWSSEEKITPTQPSAPQKTVRIRLFEGQAEVYRNGNRIGATPLETQAPVNEQLSFVLKRTGHQDLSVQFKVSDNETKNEAVYQMHRAESEE